MMIVLEKTSAELPRDAKMKAFIAAISSLISGDINPSIITCNHESFELIMLHRLLFRLARNRSSKSTQQQHTPATTTMREVSLFSFQWKTNARREGKATQKIRLKRIRERDGTRIIMRRSAKRAYKRGMRETLNSSMNKRNSGNGIETIAFIAHPQLSDRQSVTVDGGKL